MIGMLWLPFISQLDPARLHAVLALLTRVLAFVGVEILSETIAYAVEAADPATAAGAAVIGFAFTFGGMVFASKWSLLESGGKPAIEGSLSASASTA